MPYESFFVPCRVMPGMFDSEFYVMLEDASAYVSRKSVRVSAQPAGDPVAGQVRVVEVQRRDDRSLVELPGQAAVGNARVWVPSDRLTAA